MSNPQPTQSTQPPNHTTYYNPALARSSDGPNYDHGMIKDTVYVALDLIRDGHQIGELKFPQAFNKYPFVHLEHAVVPVFEFPILKEGVYDGEGNPGPDRVVFGSVNKDFKSANYIGIVSVKDNGTRVVHADLSVNNKDSLEQFTAEELADVSDYKFLTPPADAEVISSADVKLEFQN